MLQKELPRNPYAYFVEHLRRIDVFSRMKAAGPTMGSVKENTLAQGQRATQGVCSVKGNVLFWGLPHIMRLIDVQALHELHRRLSSAKTLLSSTEIKEGEFRIRLMTSLYGPAVFYGKIQPHLDMIHLNQELLIRGPRFEKAVNLFALQIMKEVFKADSADNAIVHGVHVTVPGRKRNDPGTLKLWTIAAIRSSKSAFITAIKTATVAKRRIVMSGLFPLVVTPSDGYGGGADSSFSPSRSPGRGAETWQGEESAPQRAYHFIEKQYSLHFQKLPPVGVVRATDDAAPANQPPQSFAMYPLASLCLGLFFSASDAQSYFDVFGRVDPTPENASSDPTKSVQPLKELLLMQLRRHQDRRQTHACYEVAMLLAVWGVVGGGNAALTVVNSARRMWCGEVGVLRRLMRENSTMRYIITELLGTLPSSLLSSLSGPSLAVDMMEREHAMDIGSPGAADASSAPKVSRTEQQLHSLRQMFCDHRRSLLTCTSEGNGNLLSALLAGLRPQMLRLIDDLEPLRRCDAILQPHPQPHYAAASPPRPAGNQQDEHPAYPQQYPHPAASPVDIVALLSRCRGTLVQLGHCCRALLLSAERDVSMVMQGGVVGGIGPTRAAVERCIEQGAAEATALNDGVAGASDQGTAPAPTKVGVSMVVNVKKETKRAVRGHKFPTAIATEATLVQYILDSRIDEEMGKAIAFDVLSESLVPYPCSVLLQALRPIMLRHERYVQGTQASQASQDALPFSDPVLLRMLRPHHSSLVPTGSNTGGCCGLHCTKPETERAGANNALVPVVYGSKAAVGLVDAAALHKLRKTLYPLLNGMEPDGTETSGAAAAVAGSSYPLSALVGMGGQFKQSVAVGAFGGAALVGRLLDGASAGSSAHADGTAAGSRVAEPLMSSVGLGVMGGVVQVEESVRFEPRTSDSSGTNLHQQARVAAAEFSTHVLAWANWMGMRASSRSGLVVVGLFLGGTRNLVSSHWADLDFDIHPDMLSPAIDPVTAGAESAPTSSGRGGNSGSGGRGGGAGGGAGGDMQQEQQQQHDSDGIDGWRACYGVSRLASKAWEAVILADIAKSARAREPVILLVLQQLQATPDAVKRGEGGGMIVPIARHFSMQFMHRPGVGASYGFGADGGADSLAGDLWPWPEGSGGGGGAGGMGGGIDGGLRLYQSVYFSPIEGEQMLRSIGPHELISGPNDNDEGISKDDAMAHTESMQTALKNHIVDSSAYAAHTAALRQELRLSVTDGDMLQVHTVLLQLCLTKPPAHRGSMPTKLDRSASSALPEIVRMLRSRGGILRNLEAVNASLCYCLLATRREAGPRDGGAGAGARSPNKMGQKTGRGGGGGGGGGGKSRAKMDFLHSVNQAVQPRVLVAQFATYRQAVQSCIGGGGVRGTGLDDDMSSNIHLHGAALAVDPLLARVAAALNIAGDAVVKDPVEVVGWLLEARGLLRAVRCALAWDLHLDSPQAQGCIRAWLELQQ
jgi:hypothetical protein